MKLISWNVNGIRSVMKKGFTTFAESTEFDVMLLQEVRALQDEAGLDFPGMNIFWYPAQKRGYAGTAFLSREKPLNVIYGMDNAPHDQEGRVLTLEFPDFFLTNVYVPNAQRDLARLPYKMNDWHPAFLNFLKGLEKKKPVVFGGDLNVAHEEIDLARPKANRKNAGFTDEERAGFSEWVSEGFVDTFRQFEKGGGHYTWWSYRGGAREKNVGWRIDYFLASEKLKGALQSASILPHVQGSDHCPVDVTLDI